MNVYNKKIVRTPSYIELWEYEQPIISNKTKKDSTLNKKEETKQRRKFDELTPEEQNKRMERMKKTRQHAKWELLRLVDCNFDEKTSFLTLTTKENFSCRNDFLNILKSFIKRYNYHIFKTKKSKLKYIAVLEKQERGAWHAHILLFSVPFVPHKTLLKIWGHGAVRINKVDVDSKDNRGRYVTKYFEKGIGQELLESFTKRAYLSSRNLNKPQIDTYYYLDETDYTDLNIVYESEFSSKLYTGANFIENRVVYKKIIIN